MIEWEYKYVYLFNGFSYVNPESVWCLMALSSSLFVEVIPLGRVLATGSISRGVNCTNLSNIFLEIGNPQLWRILPFLIEAFCRAFCSPQSCRQGSQSNPLLTHEPFVVRSSNLLRCYRCQSKCPKCCS